MKEGTIKNILDAVRDWVNNKEQSYKPGEIYESVPNEIIKMLWDGDTKFDDLIPVSGANELTPVSKLENYLHFIKIFYDIEEIKQNALTFTNHGSIDFKVKFRPSENSDAQSHFFYIDDDELVLLELNEFYTIQPGNEFKIVGYHPSGVTHEHGWFEFDNDSWDNNDILLSGKLTSLIDIVGHTDTLPLTTDFGMLFSFTPISDATGLVFPSNTTPSCYSRMFEECYNLVAGPAELPAKQLSDHCYSGMFSDCRSLTTAPKLPATKLAPWCYSEMFSFCKSLTEAPILPATMLAGSCYAHMFVDCTSLTLAPELPSTTLADYCYSRMFVRCTNITTAPDLPATTLAPGCYFGMFQGCENLNYIKCLAVNGINQNDSTTNWVSRVASTGTFIKHSDEVNWPTGNNGIPTNWNVETDEPKYFGFSFVGETPDYSILIGVEKQVPEVDGDGYNIEYSYDKINWTTLIDSQSEDGVYWPETPSEIHSEIYFRGNNRNQFNKYHDGDRDTVRFVYKQDPLLNVFGDITTLLRPEGKVDDLSNWFVRPSYEDTGGEPIIRTAFGGIFGSYQDDGVNKKIQHAQNLLLYSKILSEYCYSCSGQGLFYRCNKLVDSPKLPATTLASGCYEGMFTGCANLTSAPELPATTLVGGCYSWMFQGCTSLTEAPELPATELADGCYYNMFRNCTVLTDAPELPATTLSPDCYHSMFTGCTSLTEAPELPATTLSPDCYHSMFTGCTNLTTAPKLPATTLADSCYSYMFSGCNSLAAAPELPATELADGCYQYMFRDCFNLTAAPELPATELATSCYQYMFSYCTNLTTAPELPATTLASGCYEGMFQSCTGLTEAPELPAIELSSRCYNRMFSYCTNLTTSPELPATTLVYWCYREMFYGCRNLNYIKCLAVSGINQNNSTNNWVYDVASTGTFVKDPSASWPTGGNGIPDNWNVENAEIENYITFTALEDNVSISLNRISSNQKLLYSIDGETWTNFTTGMTITLENSGDSCYVAGMLSGNNTSSNYTQFNLPNKVSVSGNINSLWNGYISVNNLYRLCGYRLFYGCTGLVDASGLSLGTSRTTLAEDCYNSMFQGCTSLIIAPELPAIVLASSCYINMFYNCTDLTTAPTLPATTLADSCYNSMFNGCINLTAAPELPATTLARTCYNNMFYGCSSLASAPEILPATTLADSCYNNMFNGCTNLTTAPALFATTLANSCCYQMFYNCTNLTTAPSNMLPATELADACYVKMFYNCTNLTTAPDLPATTLTRYCYQHMFYNCTSLITAPELPATTLVEYCYSWMFQGCSSLTAVPELPATTLAAGCYDSMFQGCSSLTAVPELPATTLAEFGYSNMFQDCTSLTSAPALPAITLAESCYYEMFYGCTGLTSAPELPATTLVWGCYCRMFKGCTNLNYIKCLAVDGINSNNKPGWVDGVANEGTFIKNPNVSESTWGRGINGIPDNWTIENA